MKFPANAYRRVAFVFLFSLLQPVFAQRPLIAGPFGRPIQVNDEYGSGTIPISLYEDRDIEMLTSDVTRPGWISWSVEKYRADGKYVANLYSFFKTDAICLHEKVPAPGHSQADLREACKELRYQVDTIVVDTRKNTVLFLDTDVYGPGGMFEGKNPYEKQNELYAITELKPRTAKAINRISQIVNKELRDFDGPGFHEVQSQQADIVAKMVKLSSPAPVLPFPPRTATEEPRDSFMPPTLIYAPSPAPAPHQTAATVEVHVWVNEQGIPSRVNVEHDFGKEIDERAIQTVQRYKFKPAVRNGRPIGVDLYLGVHFKPTA